MADYLAGTNELEAASTYYNQLIDMDPYNASYWVGLAKCRFAAEDSEKAIEACDFALAADETFGEAYAYRGHCYFYLNNSDAAIENYTKAIEYKAFPPEMGYMFWGWHIPTKEHGKKQTIATNVSSTVCSRRSRQLSSIDRYLYQQSCSRLPTRQA